MKKLICCILAAVMLLGLAAVAYATEATTCTVTVDSLTVGAGEEVSVSLRLTDNPGFTNFGVFLNYDREMLTLERVEAVTGEITAVNPQWENADGSLSCYVTSASAEAVTGDAVLFTAVFTVSPNFTGSTLVTPVVSYIRNNSALFSVFEELTATAQPGTLEAAEEILLGDVNDDGKISAIDVTMVNMYMRNKYTLSQEQMKAADVTGDGKITAMDVTLIVMRMKNKLEKFPIE